MASTSPAPHAPTPLERREFIGALAGGLLAAPRAAEAQQVGKVFRIGVLSPFSHSFGPGPSFEAFRQMFLELGYVDGRNVVLEYRWADGRPDRLPALAAECETS